MSSDDMDPEQAAMLKKAFIMFDPTKSGFIEKVKIKTILNTLGARYDLDELETVITENDTDGTGKLKFENFSRVVIHFLEEQDEEAMQKELKEAFRLYDKDSVGYIPTSALKEILRALDDKMTNEELDSAIEEIDEDGSGTVDFDEFMEMMTG